MDELNWVERVDDLVEDLIWVLEGEKVSVLDATLVLSSSVSSGSSGLPLLAGSVGSSCGIGIPFGLILNTGNPGSFIQVPQSISDLNKPEQPGLTGSLVLPPSPPITIPLWLPRYQTGNMIPFIAVVVSEFHDGFEAAQVLNPIGGDVMVVPFPVMLVVTSAEIVPEARPELPRLGACVGEKALIVEAVGTEETPAV